MALSSLLLPLSLSASPRAGPIIMQQAAAASSASSSKAPSEAVWNEAIKVEWTKAYQSAPEADADYEIEEITGSIPKALRGTIFRNGPGNFERGGERYKHVLDGDGLLCRWSFDGASGRARFASKFVATPFYDEEVAADQVLHRNTFGTQPGGEGLNGWLANVGNVALKNPANTHVAVSWGGKCLALWEAALPCRINPATLAYEGVETFGGQLPEGSLTVTTGLGESVDKALGFGVAFTAHPREDRKRNRMVGWSWAAPAVGDEMVITISEWDAPTGALLHATPATLPTPIAPHDFALTDDWYVYVLNAMELKLAPFVLGLTGPVGALLTTGEGVKLRLVPRPDGAHAGREPVTIETDDPYFAIHHATAFDAEAPTAGGPPSLTLFTAAWPEVGPGPFLGDWGGDVPLYDEGKISPTLLLETTITLDDNGGGTASRVAVVEGACIDHPHVDPRFDGDVRVRYVYTSYCNPEGNSGSPPVGWARYDRRTGETAVWTAPEATFCEEVVIIPRPRASGAMPPDEDNADVWVAAMMFDARAGKSCLAILDGDRLEDGPVCQLWLSGFVPHGLHGCFSDELYGVL